MDFKHYHTSEEIEWWMRKWATDYPNLVELYEVAQSFAGRPIMQLTLTNKSTGRDTDKPEWGANAIFTIENNKMIHKSYYKMPAAQTVWENCVAHNGSLVPIPGREVMVQAWYQGGISVFDFTNSKKPREIAWFDRGPLPAGQIGGSWSAYYYNGYIYSNDIQKGFDVLKVTDPAAQSNVKMDSLNPQSQPSY